MTRQEFANLMAALKAAYQRDNFMNDKETVAVWYELLRDMSFAELNKSVISYIRNETFPPTVADLCRYANIIAGNDWSVDWNKLKNGAKLSEVDYPGQYAYMTIGQKVFDEGGELRVMLEFQKLHREFSLMDKQVKKELFKTGMLVWKKEDKSALEERKKAGDVKEIGVISGS